MLNWGHQSPAHSCFCQDQSAQLLMLWIKHQTQPSAHSEHHFRAPFSKLCQNCLRHWRDTPYLHASVRQCCGSNIWTICAPTTVFVSWQFSETYGIINYGSGWRKDVVNQHLEFESSAHRVTSKSSTQLFLPWPVNTALDTPLRASHTRVMPSKQAVYSMVEDVDHFNFDTPSCHEIIKSHHTPWDVIK